MQITRRGLLGLFLASSAIRMPKLNKGERRLIRGADHYDAEKLGDLQIMEWFEGPTQATFKCEPGIFRLGQHVKIDYHNGTVFNGIVQCLTFEKGYHNVVALDYDTWNDQQRARARDVMDTIAEDLRRPRRS